MHERYIINLLTNTYHGPYKNKTKMLKDMKILKNITDAFLEVGTNILDVSPEKFKESFSTFSKGMLVNSKYETKSLSESKRIKIMMEKDNG